MKQVLAWCAELILTLLYRIFSLLGKKNRIVCMSRQSDDDPVDFTLISEYMAEHHPQTQVVILSKKMGNLLLYALHMVKQTYYIATSSAIILDSYNIAVSLLGTRIKSPVIQMWHAMGNMKKFGYSALGETEGRDEKTARAMKMHKGYDIVLISSMSFADDYAEGFGLDDTSVIREAPLPKADLLADEGIRTEHRQELRRLYPELAGKRNIVYCPTFRKAASPNEEEAMLELLGSIDFDRYNFIFMRHPVSTQVIDDPRVLTYPDSPYSMLYAADYVISDYSTVIYEAGLLDVPVYLYAYDWDAYKDKRGLNIDLEHDVPTLFTSDPKVIMEAIESDSFDHEAYQEFVRRNIALPAHGSCTQHVVDLIMEASK